MPSSAHPSQPSLPDLWAQSAGDAHRFVATQDTASRLARSSTVTLCTRPLAAARVLLSCASGALWATATGAGLVVSISVALIGLVLFPCVLLVTTWRTQRQLFHVLAPAGFELGLDLYAEGLTVRHGGSTSALPWADLRHVRQSSGCVAIRRRSRGWLWLPTELVGRDLDRVRAGAAQGVLADAPTRDDAAAAHHGEGTTGSNDGLPVLTRVVCDDRTAAGVGVDYTRWWFVRRRESAVVTAATVVGWLGVVLHLPGYLFSVAASAGTIVLVFWAMTMVPARSILRQHFAAGTVIEVGLTSTTLATASRGRAQLIPLTNLTGVTVGANSVQLSLRSGGELILPAGLLTPSELDRIRAAVTCRPEPLRDPGRAR